MLAKVAKVLRSGVVVLFVDADALVGSCYYLQQCLGLEGFLDTTNITGALQKVSIVLTGSSFYVLP